MADDSSIAQYPYMFDPSQLVNKYSQYAGQALPWPSQYAGTPTDARGNPIQSYLDTQAAHNAWSAANPSMPASTTLNSTPTSTGFSPQQAGAILQSTGNWGLSSPSGNGMGGVNNQAALDSYNRLTAGYRPQQQAATPQASAASSQNPYDMNQAYLTALANPGRVTTPGATVPQSPTPSGTSNVLQQFLANWNNKGQPSTGAGNYNNRGFYDALQGNV